MKQTVLLLFALWGLSLSASNNVKLSFNIGSGAHKEIFLKVFKNYITRDVWDYKCTLDSLGKGFIEFSLDRPREAFMHTSLGNTMLFLTPADDMEVIFSYNDLANTLTFNGAGSENNNFIKEYTNKLHDPYCGAKLVKDGMSIKDYKATIFKRLDDRKALYLSYKQTHNVTPAFEYYAQGLVDYTSLKELIYFSYNMNSAGRSFPNKEEFYSFLKPDYFDNDSLLKYTQEYMSTASLFTWLLPNDVKKVPDCSKDYQTYITVYQGDTRDVLTASFLCSTINDHKEWDAEFAHFKTITSNREVVDLVNTAVTLSKQREISKEALSTLFTATDGKTLSLSQLISANKGKIIYIDIWALTCAPCIKEMPELEKLKSELKDYPFVAISLCVEENNQKWIDFLAKKAIPTENQFVINDGLLAPFCKEYIVNSFPRFFIIGADGKMVNTNAKRPSDKELRVELMNQMRRKK